MVKVGASILSANFLELGREVSQAELVGCDCIHVDVADGEFVDTFAVGMCVAKWLPKATSLRLDMHLAVNHPQKYIDAFADMRMSSIIFHPEAYPQYFQLIEEVKMRGLLVGVALLPSTSIELVRHILPYLDIIDQLAVNAGFPNQRYNSAVNDKLSCLKRLKEENGYRYEIQVDGGVNESTAAAAVRAGAETLIVGSALFESKDMARFVGSLKACAG